MYSSAGSNQENNHFSPDSKSTWLSFFVFCFFLDDGLSCCLKAGPCGVLLSLYVQTESLLTVQAMCTPRQTQVWGDWRRDPPSSFIIRDEPLPGSWCRSATQTRPAAFFWMIPWLFHDILDINIAGIPYIPSPYLYVFSQPPSKALVRSSNLGYTVLCVFSCLLVGQRGFSMIHCDSERARQHVRTRRARVRPPFYLNLPRS